MAAPVTYGIIGVGLMGMEHIRNLLHIDDARITCVADDFKASRDACQSFLRKNHPEVADQVKLYDSADALFRANACDVAIVATPNHTHRDVLMLAYDIADPHMHILVEKPMCTTLQDCREVMQAAAKRPGLTYVGLEYCYMPPVTRVNETKASTIGPPVMVSIREHRFPFLTKVRDWNRFNKNSGGTFVEKCCHFFDLFNRILAPSVPESVVASGAQDVNHLDEVYNGERSDIMDNGYVVVQYSGGRRAALDLCMFAEASHSQEELSVVGPKGKLEAFLPQLEVRTGLRARDTCGNVRVEVVDDERIKYYGHHYGSSYLEHLDILKQVQRIATGDADYIATAGLAQGLVSVAIGIAAQKSIAEGRIVQMSELVSKEELDLCTKNLRHS